MKGKYQRRKRARMKRESGGTATIKKAPRSGFKVSLEANIDALASTINTSRERIDLAQFESAVRHAQKLKRAKKKGCSNVDRNMEALGYRRVSGDEMVPEQFEEIS